MIELVCLNCGSIFSRRKAEVNRSVRLGRGTYCSKSCSITSSNKSRPDRGANAKNLVSSNRLDEFSPFRWYLARAKQRKHQVTVTLESLKALWAYQKGLCPLSGVQMVLPSTTLAHDKLGSSPWKPSLDRIDNTKGYVEGNVRFVVSMANMCRNKFDDEDVISFCIKVASHRGNW